MNTMTVAMRNEFPGIFAGLEADETVRVVIVRGAGGKAFSAGGDVAEFLTLAAADLEMWGDTLTSAERFRKPVVAAIDGYTMGAGLELAVACDFRIATLRSEFAFPEVRLGMIPGSGGTQRALRLIGMTRAKLFMMTGQRIPAERAEAWGLITQAVGNDGLDAAVAALTAELAGVTERVRLAVGCLATFVHRHPVLFAQQWASLDVLSGGRAWLAVCLGGPDSANAAQAAEHAVMGIASGERVERLEEGITILRTLFAQKGASHHGRFYRFEGVTLEPRPVQTPCPIWIASNPTGLTWKGGASASDAAVERGFRRVARYADGWMTNKLSPAEFAEQFGRIRAMARAEGRDPAALGSALYHNININEDRAAALAEAKAFLDTYYTAKFMPGFVEQWTVAGGPKECAQQLRAYFAAGLGHMALRLASWSQRGQLERFLGEVAPALGEG